MFLSPKFHPLPHPARLLTLFSEDSSAWAKPSDSTVKRLIPRSPGQLNEVFLHGLALQRRRGKRHLLTNECQWRFRIIGGCPKNTTIPLHTVASALSENEMIVQGLHPLMLSSQCMPSVTFCISFLTCGDSARRYKITWPFFSRVN